jgi:phosphoglycerate dehydrogenase-like enzyme
VFKNVAISRGMRFQFRGEFFNVLNKTNWNAPGRTVGASGFGEVTSAADPRIIQLGFKVIW